MIRAVTLSLVAIAALAAACSDGTTAPLPAPAPVAMSPAPSGAASSEDDDDDDDKPTVRRPALVRCERHPTYVGSAEIGPRGGILRVGDSRVIVPPGALDRKVFITATMPEGEFVTIRFEFQPHGLVFKKPAGLVLNAAGCDIEEYMAPAIVYLSDDGEILERIESYYSNDWHMVAAPIWHFSGYAIAW